MIKQVLRVVVAPLARWSKWLAIAQQKEYRLDRIWLYLHSPEGHQAAMEIVPAVSVLSRTGWKRPVRTPRVLILAVTSASLILTGLVGGWWWGGIWAMVVTGVVIHLTLPVWIVVAITPTAVIGWYVTKRTLSRAQQKIQQAQPFVIGITGSYGKSSTKHLLGHILSADQPVFITPKSYNTNYSIAQAIVRHYQHQPVAVIEYGAYMPGEIARIASWLQPKLGILTGFAPQHLGLFGSEQGIIEAKAEMVAALPQPKTVIANVLAQKTVAIAEHGQADVIIPATGQTAAEQLKHVSLDDLGRLGFVWRGHPVQTRLVGRHYQEIVLLAITAAVELGVSEPTIVKQVSSFQPSSGYISVQSPTEGGPVLIDDGGTANPAGFSAALELAAHFKSRQTRVHLLTAGIIDLGAKSDQIHRKLATSARPVVAQVWYFGMDGQTEFAQLFEDDFHNLTADGPAWEAWLDSLDDHDVILIEGRIPQWAVSAVKEKTS